MLIDEIEKACREFITLFLQVLDDGRLTDGQGRVVDFRNTVIIMTSNLGAAYLSDMGEGPVKSQTKELVMGTIRGHFPPEFINRIDEIIIFVSIHFFDESRIFFEHETLTHLLLARPLTEEREKDRGHPAEGGSRPLGREEDDSSDRRRREELPLCLWVLTYLRGPSSQPRDPERLAQSPVCYDPLRSGSRRRNG